MKLTEKYIKELVGESLLEMINEEDDEEKKSTLQKLIPIVLAGGAGYGLYKLYGPDSAGDVIAAAQQSAKDGEEISVSDYRAQKNADSIYLPDSLKNENLIKKIKKLNEQNPIKKKAKKKAAQAASSTLGNLALAGGVGAAGYLGTQALASGDSKKPFGSYADHSDVKVNYPYADHSDVKINYPYADHSDVVGFGQYADHSDVKPFGPYADHSDVVGFGQYADHSDVVPFGQYADHSDVVGFGQYRTKDGTGKVNMGGNTQVDVAPIDVVNPSTDDEVGADSVNVAYRKNLQEKPYKKKKDISRQMADIQKKKNISKQDLKKLEKLAKLMATANESYSYKEMMGLKEAIHHSQMRIIYIPKKDMKKALKVIKSMPFSLKGKVEIEKKLSDKVKNHFRIITTKQLFNAVVEYLATADVGVKTISKGKM